MKPKNIVNMLLEVAIQKNLNKFVKYRFKFVRENYYQTIPWSYKSLCILAVLKMASRNLQKLGAANYNTLLATIQGDVAENKGREQ